MTDTEMMFAIIAIIATVTPIICNTISSVITSINNLKIEKLKLFDTQRIESLNNFIETSNEYLSLAISENQNDKLISSLHKKMIKSFLNLQIYFNLDQDTRNYMFQMERMGGYDDDWKFRNELVQKLSKIVNKHIR